MNQGWLEVGGTIGYGQKPARIGRITDLRGSNPGANLLTAHFLKTQPGCRRGR